MAKKSALENFVIFDRTSKIKGFCRTSKTVLPICCSIWQRGAGKTMMMAALILYYFEKKRVSAFFCFSSIKIISWIKRKIILLDFGARKNFYLPKKILQGDTVIPICKVETFSPYLDCIEVQIYQYSKNCITISTPSETKTTLADLHKLNRDAGRWSNT